MAIAWYDCIVVSEWPNTDSPIFMVLQASNVSVILNIIAEHVPRTPLKIENSMSFAPILPKPPLLLGSLYPLFFHQELNPVAPKAQKKVPVPEGLDLDTWIHEPVPDPEPESSEEEDDFLNERDSSYGYGWSGEGSPAGKSSKKSKKGRDQEDSADGLDDAKAKVRMSKQVTGMRLFKDDQNLTLTIPFCSL
jgi:AP-3 complex subunit delta-1